MNRRPSLSTLGTPLRRALAAAGTCLLAGAGQATVLQFNNFNVIGPATYGDRVSTFNFDYGSGGGATPNIELDFFTSLSVPSAYQSGYATLNWALGHNAFNVPGSILLTPDAGFDVVISSFQAATWLGGSYPNSRIQVADTSGTVFFDTGLFTFSPGVVLNYPGAAIRSTLPLRIVVQDFGNLGIDNITFSQVATVPEASTWAMLLGGLAVVGGLARRRCVRPAGGGRRTSVKGYAT